MSKWPPADADTSCSAHCPAVSGHEAVPVPVSPGYGLSSQPLPWLRHEPGVTCMTTPASDEKDSKSPGSSQPMLFCNTVCD
ncbi:hypothetical protein J4Q44_G00387950 [Coregonus suidteri]|uniref:Uncharacterized protein n=1 Tax=Coregonus suidteri TaxID=861788 RepID=A0AAN8KL57_9TELE